jgi:CO/xanthine dehydrogenase Mo-binding subunit
MKKTLCSVTSPAPLKGERAASTTTGNLAEPEINYDELVERVDYDFGLSRRSFVKVLGAGLLIAATLPALAQESGRRSRGGSARTLGARIHIGRDGVITVLTGKVEGGQGARTELSQAAAEELGVPLGAVQMLMADTGTTPDDGGTYGSMTTPRTVPPVRHAAAAARNLLIEFAAHQWNVERGTVAMRDGKVFDAAGKRSITYAGLANSDEAAKLFEESIPTDVELTPVKEWKVLGVPALRPNARDIVVGAHKYPSDIARPGMLYGKILRAPAYHANLVSIDLAPARAMKGVGVARDDQFVGVAAPNSSLAEAALDKISNAAKWEDGPSQPSNKELFDYLEQNAAGGVPQNPYADKLAGAKVVRQTYRVPYIQHAPLEPRAAVAEWNDDKLTVWTGSQNPFGVRSELARAFHLPPESVRVVIPDFGTGYGGKHTGECAIEAARLARAAGKPVSLRWTREKEFTWAYFRPAGVIDAEASLDAHGKIATWHFININSGAQGVDTPYDVGKKNCHYVASKPPLRHGSYRGLAATANNFAREVFMDEIAAVAGADPLEFRLAHLENARLRAVLEKTAKEFGWITRVKKKDPGIGVGLACGMEKGSVVAACVEVVIDRKANTFKVSHVCQAFECGKILNPANLLSQVQGGIIMGLGAALREEVQFENGRITNASFRKYRVPRFDDVPELDIHLMDRPDLPSAGAGETPIIVIAPAVANAVFHATGKNIRALPVRLAAV